MAISGFTRASALAFVGLISFLPASLGQETSGTWPVEHAWSDPAAGPGDRSQGSFAYAYRHWVKERAARYVAEGRRLDCGDLAITLVCEYAAEKRLPVTWTVPRAEGLPVTVSSSSARFRTPGSFAEWSCMMLNVKALVMNTEPVSYEEWAGGDMVLMDWTQTKAKPNGAWWHLYLIGEPDAAIFQGSHNKGRPQPVVCSNADSKAYRLRYIRTHPDRYGKSPRRFRFLCGAVWGPEAEAPTRTPTSVKASLPREVTPELPREVTPERPREVTPEKASPPPAPRVEARAGLAARLSSPPTRKHRVRRGDTLHRIARRYGVTTPRLALANGLAPGKTIIRVGQELKIPEPQPGRSLCVVSKDGARRWHWVEEGNSLLDLPRRYGVTLQQIVAMNPRLQRSPRLYAGQLLVLPAAAVPGPQVDTLER